MASIERFEDVKAWQVGRVLANMVYDLTDQMDFSKDFGLRICNAQYRRRI